MKKQEPVFDFSDLVKVFDSISNHSLFSHIKYTNPVELGILGHGIYLIDMDIPENRKRNMKYGNLYKEDKNGKEITINGNILKLRKLSKEIFRVGGIASGFKDNDYCELIHYEHVSRPNNACLGNHCLIDIKGKIVFESDSSLHYPYYHKGVIVSCNNIYYNLKTGQPFAEGHSSVSSKDFLFLECYSYKKTYPSGVYKIKYETGEFEIFEK
ncbi:MAG: hypothetical protein WC554_12330 [Clostridia bacterium]